MWITELFTDTTLPTEYGQNKARKLAILLRGEVKMMRSRAET